MIRTRDMRVRSMRRNNKRISIGNLCIAAGACLLLTGCGSTRHEVITMNREPYEKLTYETAEVQKGDLEPELTLKLRAEGYEKITYDATNGELKLDKVHVSVGDRVSKGDLLVSFESESLQQTIDSYEEQCTNNQLLIDHYTRLMEIDSSLDYSADIASMRQDMEVAQLYVEEAKEKLARYQIVAEADGTITDMDNSLQNGTFEPGRKLITQVSGTGKYETERPEGYDFTVGETYTANVGAVSYEIQVAEVGDTLITFSPISDMSSVSEADTLELKVKKPVIEDVVYVDSTAVHEADDSYYVYVIDDEGYREAVFVTVGDRVAKYTIITEGLSGGEKVTVN